ncbi:MAG: hypothetical protein NZ898_06530 [Myxococcota bacterium]|nr:hypothetical protein [Myxococcota bacterium]MDW8362442.1 hypothetical protein [Myxococcales bacterium]
MARRLLETNAVEAMHDADGTRTTSERALRILAKSVYRELKQSGYGRAEIVAFANELLEHVTRDIRQSAPPDQPEASS